jgi:Leucine-rich repeat (LRR) protein
MIALEIVDFSNNKLESVGELYNSKNLADISISNNNLTEIPPEFARLTKIRNLNILGHPQKLIRSSTIQQGTDAILKVVRHCIIFIFGMIYFLFRL